MDKYELFDKYLAGNLNDLETDSLIELLKNDEVGRELVEYSLETKLFVDYGRKVKGKISRPVKTTSFKKSGRRKSYLPVLLIAAMLLFAFLGLQLFNENNKALLSSNGSVEVTREGQTLTKERGLEEGDTVNALEDSEITFKDGSSLELSAGTLLKVQELVLNKVIYLDRGKITVHAMPQELGSLKVITADSLTEVIGTKFSVHKLQRGTILEVIKGKVRFSNERETLDVTHGSLVYTDPKTGMIQKKPSEENFHWKIWNKLNRSAKNLHFYTDFIGGVHKGKLIAGHVKVDSQNRHFLHEGIITFPKSFGFEVKNKITMFAWVRLKEKAVHSPVLTKGDSSWRLQVNHGKPHIGYGGTSYKNFFDSKEVLNTQDWYMIHQVIDEGRVMIYLNGEKVTDKQVSEISLNNKGVVMIGGNSDKKGLFFKGDIGEAGLFDRALSPFEIKDMYELGKFK